MGFDVCVPHKTMTPERIAECNEIMIRGNLAFHKWMPFITRKRSKSCRRAIIKGKMNEVLQYIPSERRGEFIEDVPAILLVESVMTDVIGHNVKMINKLAIRWARRNDSEPSIRRAYLDTGDIAQEGFLAMFDVIRNYDRPEIQFITYAWTACNRRMFQAIMETAPISCFTRGERKLLQKVMTDQTKSGCKKSLLEFVNDGVVTEKESDIVREMLAVKVVLASRLNNDDGMFDFTTLRQGALTDTKGQPNDSWELYDFIERAGLSDFEQDALLSAMTPTKAWRQECALRHTHVNHESGLPLTRQANLNAFNLALKTACRKIRCLAGLSCVEIDLVSVMSEKEKQST